MSDLYAGIRFKLKGELRVSLREGVCEHRLDGWISDFQVKDHPDLPSHGEISFVHSQEPQKPGNVWARGEKATIYVHTTSMDFMNRLDALPRREEIRADVGYTTDGKLEWFTMLVSHDLRHPQPVKLSFFQQLFGG